MSDALRTLLAEFVVEVDKAGALARGNTQVEALKDRLHELTSVARVSAKAVSDVFSRAGVTANKNLMAINAAALGSAGAGPGTGGFAEAGARRAQLGPARDTLNQARQATYQAEQAAAAYAGTLRGKLAGAIGFVRKELGRKGDTGPGLIASLATVRNGFLALGVGAVARGAVHLVDSIGDISEGAARLGVTTDDFQRLSVLAKINATDVGTLGTAFRNLADAAVQPTTATTAAFKRLGVDGLDPATGKAKAAQALFFEVGAALAGVTNESERSALAQDLLGRSAQELKPIFAAGTEEFERQRMALLKLNVISAETIEGADRASDDSVILGTQLMAAAEPLLKLLIPAMQAFIDVLTPVVAWLAKTLKNVNLGRIAFVAMGLGASKLVGPLRLLIGLSGGIGRLFSTVALGAGKAALSLLRVVAPLLIIEDLIGFLSGDDSAIGRTLDKLFGEGASTAVLEALAKAYGMIASAIKSVATDLGLIDLDAKDRARAGQAKIDYQNSNFATRVVPALQSFLAPGGRGVPGVSFAAPGANGPSSMQSMPIEDNRTQSITINMSSGDPRAVGREVAGAITDLDATQASMP